MTVCLNPSEMLTVNRQYFFNLPVGISYCIIFIPLAQSQTIRI